MPPVKMVLLASPVALDPLDLKDQLDQSDLLADLAAMASPEALVLKAKLEHQVSPEAQAKMELQGVPGAPDPLAL